MRYFCPECKSELTIESGTAYCCYCSEFEIRESKFIYMQPIPEWETPDQYKARTGREWKGAVWVKAMDMSRWISYPIDMAGRVFMLCADKDCAPLDDYQPEE